MLTKDRYTWPMFLGTIGMVLTVLAAAYKINPLLHLLVSIGSVLLLGYGSKLIKKEYKKEKAKKIQWTILPL